MTTAKAKIKPTPRQWQPYPDLPKQGYDMQQSRPALYLIDMLRSILTPGYAHWEHPSIVISNEVPIYYAPDAPPTGGPPPHVIPDCLVAVNVDAAAIWRRVGYDPVQNGKPPDLVIEVASRRTRRNDMLRKRDLYRRIGVPEYWHFDPTGGRHYGLPIIGERLVNGHYEQILPVEYDDGSVGVAGLLLNLEFRWDGQRFRIYDPATGEEYEHWQQTNTRLVADNARLTDAKDRMSAEIARLQAEIRRLREEPNQPQ